MAHLRITKEEVSPLTTEHGETIYELIGRETTLRTERHSLAHIALAPGKASLLHFHPEAEESYYILQGTGEMALDGVKDTVVPGSAILVKPTVKHQLFNTGAEPLVFLAICAPAWEPNNSIYL